MRAPTLRNLLELRAFLGLVNYYRSFLVQMATLLPPFCNLLNKQAKRKWLTDEQAALEVKWTLQYCDLMVHFDPTRELIGLWCITRRNWSSIVLQHWWLRQAHCFPIQDFHEGGEELLSAGKGSVSLKFWSHKVQGIAVVLEFHTWDWPWDPGRPGRPSYGKEGIHIGSIQVHYKGQARCDELSPEEIA